MPRPPSAGPRASGGPSGPKPARTHVYVERALSYAAPRPGRTRMRSVVGVPKRAPPARRPHASPTPPPPSGTPLPPPGALPSRARARGRRAARAAPRAPLAPRFATPRPAASPAFDATHPDHAPSPSLEPHTSACACPWARRPACLHSPDPAVRPQSRAAANCIAPRARAAPGPRPGAPRAARGRPAPTAAPLLPPPPPRPLRARPRFSPSPPPRRSRRARPYALQQPHSGPTNTVSYPDLAAAGSQPLPRAPRARPRGHASRFIPPAPRSAADERRRACAACRAQRAARGAGRPRPIPSPPPARAPRKAPAAHRSKAELIRCLLRATPRTTSPCRAAQRGRAPPAGRQARPAPPHLRHLRT